MESYDIQTAGHIDTLKLICKTSLKANQLIDIGDLDGYQKMSKVYDALMKSGKFTAAQNKSESGEVVDSVGELIEMCEKQGYIERFYVE
jgi:polyhydroxyalkanoate synthesis regulator phasin